jgi:hypothetical protein
MVNYGYQGNGEDDIVSTPDVEFMNNSTDEFNLNEEEKLSSISKNSFLNL